MSDIGAWFFGLLAMLPGFGPAAPAPYSGYVEADYLYVAATTPGLVAEIPVHEGQLVAAGTVLVRLASGQQQAAVAGAEARVTAAEANLRNLESGSRQEELAVVRASLAKAEADKTLAEQNLARAEKLFAQGIVPAAQVDQARAAANAAAAQVAQLTAQLAVSELPARSEQQIAAQASLDAARADAEQARANLADRTLLAPDAARVERLYFNAGEMAPAGTPVIALLPPEALKVRFFVPEAERAARRLGETFNVTCDGCAAPLTAELTYIAADPQFTAPIIYSREERVRLVYMAEARLSADSGLQPGQPVSVEAAK